MDLEKLKSDYEKVEKKYKLPSFKDLNEAFEIDKIEKESDTIARSVRKAMMEKIVNSLGFLEMLLNPMNIPRMYLSFIRVMNQEDKKIIEDIYNRFSELSMNSLECEIDYSEKNEAELIKKIYKNWMDSKSGFKKIFSKMKLPGNNSSENKKERSYFG